MIKNSRYLLIAIVLCASFVLPSLASAAQLSQTSVRLGRLGRNAGSGGASDNNDLLVTFKMTNVTGVTKLAITFPATKSDGTGAGFTLTAGTPTPTSATTDFTATPATTVTPGTFTSTVTSSGAGAGGSIVISGISSPSAGVLYGLRIPAGSITNPAAAGQYNTIVETRTTGNAAVETTTAPVSVYGLSGNNEDQVAVSASVAPNFSFELLTHTDTVPQVDPSAIQTSPGVQMRIGTNSPLGYTAYVKSKNAALNSPSSSGTIPTGTFSAAAANTVSAGTNFYGFVPTNSGQLACSSCTGTLTFDNTYSESGTGTAITSTTKAGAFNTTNFSSFVSRQGGYTNADVVLLRERVAVSNTVPYANDYADTLTIVAAGNF